jgi:hypothetical protein
MRRTVRSVVIVILLALEVYLVAWTIYYPGHRSGESMRAIQQYNQNPSAENREKLQASEREFRHTEHALRLVDWGVAIILALAIYFLVDASLRDRKSRRSSARNPAARGGNAGTNDTIPAG